MNNKRREAAELEAELLRLNELVRRRRAQLERLTKCPNKSCECRLVWREVVERNLATQMGRVRRQVRGKAGLARNGSQGRAAKVRRAALSAR